MPSLASKTMPFVVTLFGSKRKLSSAEATQAEITAAQARPKRHTPPKRLNRTVDVSISTVDGWPVYELSPRDITAERRAVYLHGGAYIREIVDQHWTLCAQLAVNTATRVTVPIYPLAPKGTAATVVGTATDIAARLIDEAGADHTIIMGDSAGGGMALAVALQLRDRGVASPKHTVLISPWLDVTLSDPAIATIAPTDPFLASPGRPLAGKLYAGDLPTSDPRVSPILGDLAGLGPITMLSGTHDILNVDAHRLVDLATVAGLPLDFHEEAEMLHVYPLLPIPEAKKARTIIEKAMTRESS